MRKEKYILLFFSVLLLCAMTAGLIRNGARGQEGGESDELEKRVVAILGEMQEGPDAIWRTGRRIEGLGVGVVPTLLAKWKALPPRQEIAVSWALSRLGHRTEVLERTLEKVRNEANMEVRVLHAGLLRTVATAQEGEKIESLLDDLFEPRIKIPLCQALWDSAKSLRAKKELKALLKSDDETVQIAAAMALAEVGDVEPGKRILRRLAEEPTTRGRLAYALLREYDLKRAIERSGFQNAKAADEKFDQPVLDEIREKVLKNYVDKNKTVFARMAGNAASGIAAHLDPYSAYLSPKILQKMARIRTGELTGIGLTLGFSLKKKEGEDFRRVPVVIAAHWNGPAYFAGIRPQDELWEIDGQSSFGKSLEELEGMIAGKPGSQVVLTLYHKGWFRERKVPLTRKRIESPAILLQRLPADICVIKIPRMALDAGTALAKSIQGKGFTGAKGLILDLRDNPGGSLETAVDLAGAFLPEGTPVYSVQARNPDLGMGREFKTVSAGGVSLPLVVLINAGSAGAAEVLAGAIRDHKRGTLVGTESFGRGTLQIRFPLKATAQRTVLNLTVAACLLPKSGTFDGIGIKPDRDVPARRMEIWRHDEIQKVIQAGHVEKYLEKHFEGHLELFKELARGDEGKVDRYPEFDAWFATTATKAEKDDLRGLLREGIRRRLSQKIGTPLFTDIQEDEPLRCAVAVLAEKLGLDLSTIPEFAPFAGKY
ncbi:MAG: S41 family peptidase [Planctomycetota bacterium]|jgi:carboxyl-terminal processing protease